MELRHLRYFLAIAEERHFTRAAVRLGIAQPPLSQQIKQLELELGVPLFARGARGITLTDAGLAFLPHAESAVREAERAAVAAQQVMRGEQGTLQLGVTSSASLNPVVAALISGYRSDFPSVDIHLVELGTSALLAKLESGVIDLAFLRPTLPERDVLASLSLPDERLWVALPTRHRLAGRKTLSVADLRDEPFILYPQVSGRRLYDSIIAACHAAGFNPRIVQEAPHVVSTINLVAVGLGVAMVPACVCQLRPKGVRYVRLSGPAILTQLWLVHQPGAASVAVRNFVKRAEQVLNAKKGVKRPATA